MEKLFVSYEIAKQLKEKDFNEICLGVYVPLLNGTAEFEIGLSDANKKDRKKLVSAPLYQQVVDWFREKHQLFIEIQTDCTSYPKFAFEINRFIGNPNDLTEREWDWENIKVKEWHLYRTHKEAMDYAIEEALKLI